MERKIYYVYALNIKEKEITAALPFQDKEAAKWTYEVALREMEEKKYSTFGFHFGYTEDGLQIRDDDFTEVSRVKIEYPLSSRHGYQEGWTRPAIFETNDFEEAECNTAIILAEDTLSDNRRDIQFMHFVKEELSLLKTDAADCPHMTQAVSRRGNQELAKTELVIANDTVSPSSLLSSREDELRKILQQSPPPPLPKDGKSNDDWMTLSDFANEIYKAKRYDDKAQSKKKDSVRSYLTPSKKAAKIPFAQKTFGIGGQGYMKNIIWCQKQTSTGSNDAETGYFFLKSSIPSLFPRPKKVSTPAKKKKRK